MTATTTILVHIGYALMLLGFLARDVLWLRGFLVFGQSTVVVYAWGAQALPVAYWNAAFAIINLSYAVLIIRERRLVEIPAELRDLYADRFAIFSPREFVQLWRTGHQLECRDDFLMREGERQTKLLCLLQGEVRIEKAGHEVARLGRGRFLAEMSFLTSEPASADVRAGGLVRYIAWDSAWLQRWKVDKPALWTKLQGVLGRELVDKIKIANLTVIRGAESKPAFESQVHQSGAEAPD